jgi:pyridoxine 5-phosphate synthase
MIELGVNIDHVATIRQARRTYEPDPVLAASLAELGGADTITVHLREDRRHIQDRDVRILKNTVHVKLNFELSCAPEIVEICCQTMPAQATLVPERREEVTTEGGLNLLSNSTAVKDAISKLNDHGIEVSLFLDPDREQIERAHQFGVKAIELHTGKYALTSKQEQRLELDRLTNAGLLANDLGLRLHAGHGLTYHNVMPIAQIPHMHELNIGHSIISRAIFVGLQNAVSEMKQLIRSATIGSP